MSILAQLVVLGSVLLAPVPKQRGMDPQTIAAFEKLGAVYGTLRTMSNGRLEFVSKADDPDIRSLPAFHFSYLIEGKIPEVPVPYGLVLSTYVSQIRHFPRAENLTSVVLRGSSVSSDVLKLLVTLPDLRHLRFTDASQLDDAALDNLGGIAELVSIDLQTNTKFTTAGWKNLGRLKKLEVLLLPTVEIPLAELAAVADPKALRSLEVLVSDERECGELRRFENLQSLTLTDKNPKKLGDGGIRLIGPLKKLRRFDASRTHVGDGAMTTLAASKELRELRLARTLVTDAGIEALSDLVKLQTLDLTGSQIGGTGLASFPELVHLTLTSVNLGKGGSELGTLQNLEYLHLGLGNPSFEALDAVSQLPKLKTLNLNMTRTTDEVLKNLKCTETLERLMVPNTLITDEGVIALKACKKLIYLHVENTRLTDACVPTLIQLSLRDLVLVRTNVTEKHLDELMKSKTLHRVHLDSTRVPKETLERLEKTYPQRQFR